MNKTLTKALMPVFRLLAKPGISNPHTPYEAELMVAGVKPIAIMLKQNITPDIFSKINGGEIIVIGEKEFVEGDVKTEIIVLAQKKHEQDGIELFDRFYSNGNNSPPIIDGCEWNARIGKLLGYTDNDIALSNRTKYMSLASVFLLSKTDKIRTFARKEVLLNCSFSPSNT